MAAASSFSREKNKDRRRTPAECEDCSDYFTQDEAPASGCVGCTSVKCPACYENISLSSCGECGLQTCTACSSTCKVCGIIMCRLCFSNESAIHSNRPRLMRQCNRCGAKYCFGCDVNIIEKYKNNRGFLCDDCYFDGKLCVECSRAHDCLCSNKMYVCDFHAKECERCVALGLSDHSTCNACGRFGVSARYTQTIDEEWADMECKSCGHEWRFYFKESDPFAFGLFADSE